MSERYQWGGEGDRFDCSGLLPPPKWNDLAKGADVTAPTSTPPASRTLRITGSTIMSESRVMLTIRPDVSGFRRALRQVSRSLHVLGARFGPPADRRKHRRRCPICNPAGHPPPLNVNGADYHRRRNNRRKRR